MIFDKTYTHMHDTLEPYFVYVDEPYPETDFYVRLKDDAPDHIKALFKEFIKTQIWLKQSGLE